MKLLTTGEIADFLGVSKQTIKRRVKQDGMPALRIGAGPKAPLRFRRDQVVQWASDMEKGTHGWVS